MRCILIKVSDASWSKMCRFSSSPVHQSYQFSSEKRCSKVPISKWIFLDHSKISYFSLSVNKLSNLLPINKPFIFNFAIFQQIIIKSQTFSPSSLQGTVQHNNAHKKYLYRLAVLNIDVFISMIVIEFLKQRKIGDVVDANIFFILKKVILYWIKHIRRTLLLYCVIKNVRSS